MQYRLRTLLIAITICCAVLARVVYVRQQRDIHREALSKIFSLYLTPFHRMDEDHWYEARDHSRLAVRYEFESQLIIVAVVSGVTLGLLGLSSWRILQSRLNPWVRGTLCVIVLFLAPTVYVLSSGPAVWLVRRGYISGVHIPYAPIHWGIGKSDSFRRFIWWYLEFWDEGMRVQSASPFDPGTRFEDWCSPIHRDRTPQDI